MYFKNKVDKKTEVDIFIKTRKLFLNINHYSGYQVSFLNILGICTFCADE
jgi:hypothetical protein